jgi:hypothetical protein
MDIAVLGLGCTSAAVTGSLTVTGTWTAYSNGTYLDGTTTVGDEHLTLPASCLQISGTTTTCERVAPVLQSLGYAVTMCTSAASGGCTCSATVNQTGWMGVVNLGATTRGQYTTSGTEVTLDNEARYSFCVPGNQLNMTPQGTSPTTAGTVVLQKSGSIGSGGSTATGDSGGAAGSGGVFGSGGIGGTGGTTGSSSVYGMPCTTNQDCPSDAVCCDGSSESCDGTRLPTGDGTSSKEFVVSADGLTVTDTITGLVWQRDGSGTRAGCATDSTHLTCTQAEGEAYCSGLLLGGFSDWRLPAEHELHTIVDLTQSNPAIDLTVFPRTTAGYYWTSSTFAVSPGEAWYVDFTYGKASCDIVSPQKVRCVRGARCYPASRFVVLSGGLVSDTLTNLVWQQQASTKTMAWAAAQTYCSGAGSGFRLPTMKELLSIVDFTVQSPLGPMINQTAFPSTPADAFWTSSPFDESSNGAWSVDFSHGGSGDVYVSEYCRVRCVR